MKENNVQVVYDIVDDILVDVTTANAFVVCTCIVVSRTKTNTKKNKSNNSRSKTTLFHTYTKHCKIMKYSTRRMNTHAYVYEKETKYFIDIVYGAND